jgi:RNA polymerase sigma-70 factor, ECF subfamily
MPSQPDQILEMFATYQRRLYAYIISMLPNRTDADDVLQNTNIVVWQKLDQFKPDTDFRAWVFRICYYEICKFRERNRSLPVKFSSELLDELSGEYRRREDLLESRQAAMPGCVAELPPADRELVDSVYGRQVEVPHLAQQTGREPTSIYRSLRRIRQWLHDCVERTVRREGQS